MPGPRRGILSTLFAGDDPMPVWQNRFDMLRPRPKDAATIALLAGCSRILGSAPGSAAARRHAPGRLILTNAASQLLQIADKTLASRRPRR